MSRRNQRCGSRLGACEGNALFSGIGEHSRRCASARETLGRFGLLAFVQKAGERDSATPATDTSHETMSRTPIFKTRISSRLQAPPPAFPVASASADVLSSPDSFGLSLLVWPHQSCIGIRSRQHRALRRPGTDLSEPALQYLQQAGPEFGSTLFGTALARGHSKQRRYLSFQTQDVEHTRHRISPLLLPIWALSLRTLATQ